MSKDKMALYAALASLSSNSIIAKLRNDLEFGVQGAFRSGFSFEFSHAINAVNFGDLSFFFSEEHDKVILVFLYPGSTIPGRLNFPGMDLPFNDLKADEFCEFLNRGDIEFRREMLNQYVLTITSNGAVFYFDLTNDDRRIDITNSHVASGVR